MPRKPKHPCAHPGCPELVEAGQRYCEKHQKERNRQYERYGRDPATKKRYGSRWSKIRAAYIAAHPLCEQCLADGRATAAREVHHKVPLSEGGTNATENLQALCKSCHSKIHAERGDRWGRERPQGEVESP